MFSRFTVWMRAARISYSFQTRSARIYASAKALDIALWYVVKSSDRGTFFTIFRIFLLDINLTLPLHCVRGLFLHVEVCPWKRGTKIFGAAGDLDIISFAALPPTEHFFINQILLFFESIIVLYFDRWRKKSLHPMRGSCCLSAIDMLRWCKHRRHLRSLLSSPQIFFQTKIEIIYDMISLGICNCLFLPSNDVNHKWCIKCYVCFCEWWPSFLRTPSEFRLWEVTKLSLSDTIYSTFVIILYIVIIKMYKSRGNNCCFLFVASVNRVKIYFECVSHCISRKVVQTPR